MLVENRKGQRGARRVFEVELQEADESTTGPASFVAADPDGNPFLADQHV